MPSYRQNKRLEVQKEIIKHFDDKIPYFTDIFDERTFYIFAGVLTILSFAAAILLSYCCQVKLDDVDELRKKKEKKERELKEKLAFNLLNERLKKAQPNSEEYKDAKEKLDILTKKCNDAKKNREKVKKMCILDDTDYEFSDEEENEETIKRKEHDRALKSE